MREFDRSNTQQVVPKGRASGRLPVLDGWRATSISLVLAGHMLPLGPKSWGLNAPVAALGMEIFFNLSGFLIVGILMKDGHVGRFLIRRLARIVPLAWLALTIVFLIFRPSWDMVAANFLFYANLPPFWLTYTSHFWSLGLEMQFYFTIAVTVLLFGQRALWFLPLAALAVTVGRIATGTEISIVTWLRADEILAGGCLALIINNPNLEWLRTMIAKTPITLIAGLFLFSTSGLVPGLDYARPYLGVLMIGITIVRNIPLLSQILKSRYLAYLANISYAVYIVHPYTMVGWMGSGDTVIKYLKRPLCFLLTFSIAHVSTFYYEKPFNSWAHRLSSKKAS